MKKWHLITVGSILAAAIVIFCGVALYNNMILPNYIEPMIESVAEYIKDDDILTQLRDEARELYDEGMLDDYTYTNFLRVYDKHFRNDEEYAREILESRNDSDAVTTDQGMIKARYASNKVGVEIIRENNTEENGNADLKYSDARTSNRIKAEDYVEAERIMKEIESTPAPDEGDGEGTTTDKIVQSAYSKLKLKMTGEEFAAITKIMSKLDISSLQSFINDKEGLKAYLHSNLTDEEFREAVNLGYKYMYVFLE